MNERERLIHQRQLLDPESAAADLQLLEEKAPRHPRLAEFRAAPKRHHDAIVYELLGYTDGGTIQENRLRVSTAANLAKEQEARSKEQEARGKEQEARGKEQETEQPAVEEPAASEAPAADDATVVSEAPAAETEAKKNNTSAKKKSTQE